MALIKRKTTQQTQLPDPVTVVQEPFKDLFVWQALARPYKRRNKEWYSTIAAIIFLLAVILIFLQEWTLIGVIVSIGFLSYVLSSVPPEKVETKITTRGIIAGSKRFDWTLLYRFWFSEKWGSQMLNVETRLGFPRRLMFVINKPDEPKIKKILEKYLILEKPQNQFVDRAGNWLQRKFPLENK